MAAFVDRGQGYKQTKSTSTAWDKLIDAPITWWRSLRNPSLKHIIIILLSDIFFVLWDLHTCPIMFLRLLKITELRIWSIVYLQPAITVPNRSLVYKPALIYHLQCLSKVWYPDQNALLLQTHWRKFSNTRKQIGVSNKYAFHFLIWEKHELCSRTGYLDHHLHE